MQTLSKLSRRHSSDYYVHSKWRHTPPGLIMKMKATMTSPMESNYSSTHSMKGDKNPAFSSSEASNS